MSGHDRPNVLKIEDMTRVTFIHTSDLQLGMIRWYLGDDGQALFDDSRLKAVARLGELAAEHGAAFIVVAGDVFEHNSLSDRVTGRALEALRALPVPVYLLPGNHDPLVADSIFRRTDGVDGVHVVADSEPIEVADGVELVGAPWRSKHPTGDLVRAMLEPLAPTEKIRVGLAHGQVEAFGGEPAPGLIDLANVETKLSDGTLDYLALGDTHSTASLGDSGAVWFSGSPETTDYHERVGDETGGEHDSGNSLVVTVEKTGAGQAHVEVEKAAVGEWTFDALHEELYSQEDVDAFLAKLDAYPDKTRTCIKYALAGSLSLTATRALQEGLDARVPVFTALYDRERLNELTLEPEDDELASLELGGVAGEAMAELLREELDDAEARDAVNLLFRLTKEIQ